MTDGQATPPGGAEPPRSAPLRDPSNQAPIGTLVLMVLLLAMMAGLWILVYRLLLSR